MIPPNTSIMSLLICNAIAEKSPSPWRFETRLQPRFSGNATLFPFHHRSPPARPLSSYCIWAAASPCDRPPAVSSHRSSRLLPPCSAHQEAPPPLPAGSAALLNTPSKVSTTGSRKIRSRYKFVQ